MTYIELAIKWKHRGNRRMALVIRDSYKRDVLRKKRLTAVTAGAA